MAKKITKAERAQWEIERQRMLENAERTRKLAERAQAELDSRKEA